MINSIKLRVAAIALAAVITAPVHAADITGAGASFIFPVMTRWSADYNKATGTRVNYQSIGSGGGIAQIKGGTVDFGSSDAPLPPEELAAAGLGQFPSAIGGVVPVVNIPGITAGQVRFTGPVLADIFLGKITQWNDPAIVAINEGVTLPETRITVVHRTDGSGTTFNFVNYLSKVSPEWQTKVGEGVSVKWPTGIGGKGNEGVAGQVKQMLGSIGYLEVVYARQNHLPVAHVRNRGGRFISPMPYEIASAAATAMDDAGASGDLRLSLVDAPGDQAYPIASFTWMLLAPERIGPVKTRQLIDFLRWALLDGGDMASSLGYVALPTVTATRVLDLLDTLPTRPAPNR